MSLEAAIKEAYAVAPSDEVILETLEITHPAEGETLYFINQLTSFDMTLETSEIVRFDPLPFSLGLPAAGENGRQDMTITLDNTDRRISDFINDAKNYPEPVKITYRPYLSSDLTTPQMNPPLTLTLNEISISVFNITAKASFSDMINRKFPSNYYTRNRFPSLGN